VKVLIHEMSWSEFEDALREVDLVIIPVGAVEAYGPHLPLGTDAIVALHIATRVAEKTKALVSPPVYVGQSYALSNFPGTLSVRTAHLKGYLKDICESLVNQGFKRIFFICGHLGNISAITDLSYELRKKHKVIVGMLDLWRFLAEAAKGIVETKEFPEGHASEVGTSVMLYLDKNLVNMKRARREMPKPKLKKECAHIKLFPYLEEVTNSGVIGDPTKATAEKGKRVVKKALENLVAFLKEFRKLN